MTSCHTKWDGRVVGSSLVLRGHSCVLENYMRKNIGFTLKLRPTIYKTCACHKDEVICCTPWYKKIEVFTN